MLTHAVGVCGIDRVFDEAPYCIPFSWSHTVQTLGTPAQVAGLLTTRVIAGISFRLVNQRQAPTYAPYISGTLADIA